MTKSGAETRKDDQVIPQRSIHGIEDGERGPRMTSKVANWRGDG